MRAGISRRGVEFHPGRYAVKTIGGGNRYEVLLAWDESHPHRAPGGPSLRRLIRRDGAIGLEQLLPLAAHVAAALQYMAG